ncbi:MAG: adenylate kinase [Dehalococcoidia bacterium]|nr:adenylate kinase [Dehalococcoidia bacterium]
MGRREAGSLPQRLIILGPPGAGKGTQAKKLTEVLDVPHIASGDLFRHHRSKGTPLGIKASEYMNNGLLVPDEITTAMVLERIQPPLDMQGYLLDGFPRNMFQAQALDDMAARGRPVDYVILISVPDDELVARLSGRHICGACQASYHIKTAPPSTPGRCDRCGGDLLQREDDRPEAVRVRIRVYNEETHPMLDHYARSGKLVEVDGLGRIDEVAERLLKAMHLGPSVGGP